MIGTGKSLGVLFGSVVAVAACGSPEAMLAGPMAPMTAGPAKVALADVVAADYREAVLKVVAKPTVSTRATAEEFVGTPAVYTWLLDHPDRTSLAWRRLKVPCVEIMDLGNGKFAWTDTDGSELVWQTVGRFPDGVVWYATGKVKASPVTPTVPVRAVVIVSYPNKPAKDGTATFTPTAQAYLQTDSRAANAVLRILGPTAPKLAEQGAEQLLLFFNGIAQYVQTHPEKSEELLAPPKK